MIRLSWDFGDHQVGYVTLDLSSAGSHQDAPAYLYLRFAERLEELGADPAGIRRLDQQKLASGRIYPCR